MAEIPAVDVRRADPAVDLRDESFEFMLVKQRFADTFVRLEVLGRERSWFLDNLLLAIAGAGPQDALEVGRRAGYRFVDGPTFTPAPRGRIVVRGRMAPLEVATIPEPSEPVLP